MIISWPIAFILLIPATVWCFYRPFANRWVTGLRFAVYLLLIAALAQPALKLEDRNGTLVVLLDRSLSMPPDSLEYQLAAMRELAAGMPEKSRLGVITFGGDARIEKLPESQDLPDLRDSGMDRHSSNLDAALARALTLVPEDAPGRIVVWSDGRWSGRDPRSRMLQAASRRIPVDWREAARSDSGDIAIVGVETPRQSRENEYFLVNLRIRATVPGELDCTVRRNGRVVRSSRIAVNAGVNNFSWRDRAGRQGLLDYEISIRNADGTLDAIPENNRARRLIQVVGRRPVLLLTHSPSGNLARVLAESDVPCEVRVPDPELMTLERLSEYALVVLENIPASELGMDGMANLDVLVRTGSLGLVMTGGRKSFASGGYYASPLEEILPVSLEQRLEARKSALAIVVALDRSGSMGAPVGHLTKMDMANLGAVEVLRLLGPRDEFGVIAVDSQPHIVLPLTPVSALGGGEARIRGIQSMGGGIFTYTALDAATKMLMESQAPSRHLILFADAADAEEPGQYRQLLAMTSAAGVTVSVIGLGSPHDSDAVFLEDVARLGGGQIYFSDRPDELPRIFAEDTLTVARSTFVDVPTRMDYTASALQLSQEGFGTSTSFDGYNLCFPVPGAEIALLSDDEFRAPIVAYHQKGLGRVAVLAAEVDGAYTGAFASDPAAGRLIASLVDYAMVPESAPEDDWMTAQYDEAEGQRIVLYLDPARERNPFMVTPAIEVAERKGDGSMQMQSIGLEWENPDRLVARIPLAGDSVAVATLFVDGNAYPLAPMTPLYSAEFRPPEIDVDPDEVGFADLCRLTGGRLRTRLDTVWEELPPRRRSFDLTPVLAAAAVLLLLLEVCKRRTGLPALPAFLKRRLEASHRAAPPPREKPKKVPRRRKKERSPAVPPPAAPPEPPSPPPAEEKTALGDALRRARRH